ncbi:hypothetical protein SAMN05519104_8288 [Rhizobiales bacterium GAS188]|nr:hypothetical protein SAMN05519104_8288 [Rhizobiales bacterium GAS188]
MASVVPFNKSDMGSGWFFGDVPAMNVTKVPKPRVLDSADGD